MYKPKLTAKICLALFITSFNCFIAAAQNDSLENGLPSNALYLIDFKEATREQVEKLNKDSISSVNVLKNKNEITKYRKEVKDAIILVFMKTAVPDNFYYQINGAESTKEQIEKLDKNSISGLEMLSGKDAVYLYGEKGQSGVVNITTKKADSYEIVFTKAEKSPEFPGGLDAWRKYLESNLRYPIAAIDYRLEGVVRVQMVVNKYGDVVETKPLNDPGCGLAFEAARVLKNGPKWIPAQQNGRDVNYMFIQSVTFKFN